MTTENELLKPSYSIELSQERLRQALDYNSFTGIFTWKIRPARNIFPGTIAGSMDWKGYIMIQVDGIKLGAHRLAWLYIHNKLTMIDHKDEVPYHNWIDNLREATYSQNNHRKKVYNPLGHTGVRFRGGFYEANIRIKGRITRVGKFNSIEEAAKAYKKAATEEFGEFANGQDTVQERSRNEEA